MPVVLALVVPVDDALVVADDVAVCESLVVAVLVTEDDLVMD